MFRKTIKNKQKICWWIRVYTGLNKPRINGRKLLNCKVAVKRCAQADRTKRNLDLYGWRPRLQRPAEIRKHSFTPAVKSTVDRLNLSEHEHEHKHEDFGTQSFWKTPWKTFFKLEEFENAGFAFLRERNRWRHDNHVNSLTKPSSNTNSKWPVIVATREVWTGHYLFMTGCALREKYDKLVVLTYCGKTFLLV